MMDREKVVGNSSGWFSKIRQAWGRFLSPQPPAILLFERQGANADLEVLLADVSALHCRAMRRSPRRRPELSALLQGAVNAGAQDPAKGRLLFDKALSRFHQATQSTNQMTFVMGALTGAALGMAVTYELIKMGISESALAGNLADPSTIASLCFFGLLGSLTSIFMRLSKLDLREDDSLVFVAISGLVQPFIALGFVAVVFVGIKYKVLGISVSADQVDAVLWVAAFLCGFSERFAPGILDSTAAALGKHRFIR